MVLRKTLLFVSVIFLFALPVYSQAAKIEGKYKVDVNYSEPLERLVSAGCYSFADSEVSVENFPPNRRGARTVEIFLARFEKPISSEKAIKELDKIGFRPAMLSELLAFGAAYPRVQLEFPVVALGSKWFKFGGLFGDNLVPVLDKDEEYFGPGGRVLLLGRFNFVWDQTFRFVAVRK